MVSDTRGFSEGRSGRLWHRRNGYVLIGEKVIFAVTHTAYTGDRAFCGKI